MEITDGIIHITVEDFEQIIGHEVSKQLVMSGKPKELFSEISIKHRDLLNINECFPVSNIEYHTLNCINQPLWIVKMDHVYSNDPKSNEIGENTHRSNISAIYIHELIRKLSLAMFGVTRNKDLNISDYNDAQEVYRNIKDLFLEDYYTRLSKIQEVSK